MKQLIDVKLREFEYSDKNRLVEIANNQNIAKNMNFGFPHPFTLEDAKVFLKKNIDQKVKTIYAILFKGNYVGNIGLFPGKGDSKKTAEIAYFIDQEFWNNGIATKATKLMILYGFDKLELHRIHAGISEYNTSSMKVLEKSGFSKDGIYIKNQITYNHRYSIINPNLNY